MLPLCTAIAQAFVHGCHDDLDDLAQMALLECISRVDRFDASRASAFNFFTKVARNAMITELRKNQRRTRQSARLLERIAKDPVLRSELIGETEEDTCQQHEF